VFCCCCWSPSFAAVAGLQDLLLFPVSACFLSESLLTLRTKYRVIFGSEV
jgi:hypothetical protein